jgi:hypothetical protein
MTRNRASAHAGTPLGVQPPCPGISALNQRIAVRFHMTGTTSEETAGYLRVEGRPLSPGGRRTSRRSAGHLSEGLTVRKTLLVMATPLRLTLVRLATVNREWRIAWT